MNMASARSCAFCSKNEPLTREHVFGDWLSTIGLENDPVATVAGPLDQIGKQMGVSRPFQTKVKNVCATCNNGWMSNLESIAKRVLTPLALGQPGRIDVADQGAISAWVQKTALMAMYLSSAEDRENGHGVAPREYTSLYAQRDSCEPLPNSMFWIGRYTGQLRRGAAWITPVAVNVKGLPEPDLPHGYTMTIAVGAILLHGVRFTDLPFYIDVAIERPLGEIWPATEDVLWPSPDAEIGDDDFLGLAHGRGLVLAGNELSLRPLSLLMDSPQSEIAGSTIEMPAPCGQRHVIYYPAVLAAMGIRGQSHWFTTGCECGVGYLVHTERTGAHVKAAGEPEEIAEAYGSLPGRDLAFRDPNGTFQYKESFLP